MSFSKQFIEICNFLASQMGIMIDWTSENIVPYMQDFSDRFIKYEISTSVVWIVIMVIIPLILFVLAKMATKEYYESDYAEGVLMIIAWMFFSFSCITSFIVVIIQIFHIIKAVNIPEQLIIEELLRVKSSLGY